LLKDREICRIRTCFEGDTLGSELLPPDVLLAERRGTLIDTVALPIRLLLFGTGPEIEPITQLAGKSGVVIECFGHPSELAADFRPDRQTAALVMTHNFGRDLLALDRLLPLPLRYVGLLDHENVTLNYWRGSANIDRSISNRAFRNLFARPDSTLEASTGRNCALHSFRGCSPYFRAVCGGFLA